MAKKNPQRHLLALAEELTWFDKVTKPKMAKKKAKNTLQDHTRDAIRLEGFLSGAYCAAEIADSYNAVTSHPYRLGDCILAKLNLTNKKPRKNKNKV